MIGVPALTDSSDILAQLAIIGAALCYAFAGVYGRRFKGMKMNPIIVSAGQVTASTIVLLPIALTVDGSLKLATINYQTWIAILALGVVSTAIAYVIYFKILELAGATNVLLVTLLVPVSAILLGALFLNETLSVQQVIGGLLVMLGLIVNTLGGRFKVKRKLKRVKVV